MATHPAPVSPLLRRPWYRRILRRWMMGSVVGESLAFGDKTLDLGCGGGWYFSMNADACGIDADMDCLRHIAREHKRVCRGNIARGLPFKSNSLRCVVCQDVLEHLDASVLASVIRDVSRILCDAGLFVVVIPNRKGYEFGLTTGAGHRNFVAPATVRSLSKGLFLIRSIRAYPLPTWLGDAFVHNKNVVLLQKDSGPPAAENAHSGVTQSRNSESRRA